MKEQNFSWQDISPLEYIEGHRKAQQKDIEFLADRIDQFVSVMCPACNGSDFGFAFEKFGFKFVSCAKCLTVFMNPRASLNILKEFYSQSAVYAYWNKYYFPAGEETRKEKIARPRVQKIIEACEKFSIPTDCLIEVGAGYGTFCAEAKASGKFSSVIAIEPAQDLAQTCREKGIETLEDGVENIKSLRTPANVVSAFEVVEHLFSPRDFLMHCRKLMAHGSLFAMTCPNFKGFETSILGLASETIDAEHINLFNPSSLSKLFEGCGFEVLECSTPGELDADIVRTKVLTKEFDIANQPFLQTLLIDRWEELGSAFQSFLKENKLSSHMWLIARNI